MLYICEIWLKNNQKLVSLSPRLFVWSCQGSHLSFVQGRVLETYLQTSITHRRSRWTGGRMWGCCKAAQAGAASIKEQVLPWTTSGSYLLAGLAISDVFGHLCRVTTRTWLQLHFRFCGPVQVFMKSKTRAQKSIKHLNRKS